MKVVRNKLLLVARYDTQEKAILMFYKIKKMTSNVHDFHREYTTEYKIYYTHKMVEQIKKHCTNYEFVYDVLASIMKICELPENKLKLKLDGKKINIILYNPYLLRVVKRNIDSRNVWMIMFKKKVFCPYCQKLYMVEMDANILKTCDRCGHVFKIYSPKEIDLFIQTQHEQFFDLGV